MISPECIGKPNGGIPRTWVMRNHEEASQKGTGSKVKARGDGRELGKIMTWWMPLAGIILYFSYILRIITDNKEIPKDVSHFEWWGVAEVMLWKMFLITCFCFTGNSQ